MMYLALALLLLASGSFGKPLVELHGSNRQGRCCKEEDILTCHFASVDPSALEEETLELPGGISVSFIDLDQDTYHYGNENVDAFITINPKTGTIRGHAQVGYMLYALENCGEAGPVWKKYDTRNFREIKHDYEDFNEDFSKHMKGNQTRVEKMKGPVTYSVKIYFTREVEYQTPYLEEYIQDLVRVTNQGYANSKLDIRMKVHCIERATISDADVYGDLYAFTNMKSSVDELRGSADAAALLVHDYPGCGRASFKIPVSVSRKNCNIKNFSFGHELGHNLQLHHNIEHDSSGLPYAHGHLIKGGYRTIMSYEYPGHAKRVNYYSNPDVIFRETGTPTGAVGMSNNARVLQENIYAFSQNGDESEPCMWNRFSLDL